MEDSASFPRARVVTNCHIVRKGSEMLEKVSGIPMPITSAEGDDATIKPRQRSELVTLLREAANLGLAGLVFGQVVSDRPFSLGAKRPRSSSVVAAGIFRYMDCGRR